MHIPTLSSTLSFLLAIQTTKACNPSRRDTNAPNPFTIGTDGPAPEATKGFALNHIGLLTTDLPAMKNFYGNILGMRNIFDAQVTAEYSVTYMGYSQGGRNGTGFQTGAEMAVAKNNMYGLLELVQFNVSDDRLIASTERTNTFGHVGLVVPDVAEAQTYLEAQGVAILKRVGEAVEDFTGPVPNSMGIGEFAGLHLEAKRALVKAQGLIGFEMFLMVTDPDGNVVEIQQQDV
ncbi:hypothetical protein PCG10_006112 [Penicillium crustosum]|uniref:VOC domain-containing protein n=1 Tax=Penicillium crustosum TaxID=36656 RepID=A0A9P5GUY5_PENCR|nr:uncharacterized protein N7487_001561 [Penicillium crustosum]KAF7529781.1 hypothetical protein PCG10_006112 [Penicillium crustosum]KAJ5418011.1 hypothetical protein N7487_001561 [Penicillium crustosum]